ncbi:beta-ketoacyl-ACP synthase III [Legionella pneumophila]|uniref:beta-ketoacyl-ACP synthase III n=1 Tax=Legionella pneumophila TaxID=446 RepID=UPI00047F2869|nr:beta-ketoacyl-ACP synthase III [Legionella pneumophila]MDW9138971.1 beta-ketoacyl-ACP synthase III [Legionella pneumophila]CZG12491.1 3-oxoacyl-[acyl-carrier-protein] synthase 3 [Legionella pneumophila]STX67551.1 3-oxoacyl-(acyl-carrier-protein) [Legionella pneumophila]GAN29824.1 3-oxoacyl-[acyl-carrier-protein] synthase 3 [Legionella pneumophila]HAT3870382.1 ketoacyl-ACP synthase III [Legionella pneumophila]
MKNAVINGTGSYSPERQITNAELETMLDTSDEWIVTRTGISSRSVAQEHETTSYMASRAAEQALEASGLDAEEIDLILVATCTPDYFFPSVACHVQHALGIKRPIPAFDIGAACSGFVYAMDVAKQYIATGAAKHVLVVGSESMSRAVDWTDRSICVLFGDGAGAVVLSASDRQGIMGSVLHSAYDSDKLLVLRNSTFEQDRAMIGMRGNEVFKIAVNIMGNIVDEVLEASHLKKSDIDWLIPHQANIRIIQAIAKKLSLPMSHVIVTIGNQGNTSAASIPLALDYSIKNNQIKRDEILLIESFGGGMTWGAMVIRY